MKLQKHIFFAHFRSKHVESMHANCLFLLSTKNGNVKYFCFDWFQNSVKSQVPSWNSSWTCMEVGAQTIPNPGPMKNSNMFPVNGFFFIGPVAWQGKIVWEPTTTFYMFIPDDVSSPSGLHANAAAASRGPWRGQVQWFLESFVTSVIHVLVSHALSTQAGRSTQHVGSVACFASSCHDIFAYMSCCI